MKYSVDRIEENIAVLEELDTGNIIEVPASKLPHFIEDGTVVRYENDEYVIDKSEEEIRRERIREKLDRLKKLGIEKNSKI